jgi:hypothetical protein
MRRWDWTDDFGLTDSYSDGMSGWVDVTDATNGHQERARWSVTDAIGSQHAAFEEASSRLLARRVTP